MNLNARLSGGGGSSIEDEDDSSSPGGKTLFKDSSGNLTDSNPADGPPQESPTGRGGYNPAGAVRDRKEDSPGPGNPATLPGGRDTGALDHENVPGTPGTTSTESDGSQRDTPVEEAEETFTTMSNDASEAVDQAKEDAEDVVDDAKNWAEKTANEATDAATPDLPWWIEEAAFGSVVLVLLAVFGYIFRPFVQLFGGN